MLLVLSLSTVVAAASILAAVAAPVVKPAAPVDTSAPFQDLDGNGVDDRCQTSVVADPAAAAAAQTAVDANGDGQISVTEAAHSGRIGGKNCNHGGYVSSVARDTDEPTTDEPTADEPTTDCVEVAPPERDPALDDQKNGHGKWVSTVAQSDAIGGKNCNHGGAVSEAAKKDHAADKAARDAAKAAKKAEREAAKLAAGHGKGKGKH